MYSTQLFITTGISQNYKENNVLSKLKYYNNNYYYIYSHKLIPTTQHCKCAVSKHVYNMLIE